MSKFSVGRIFLSFTFALIVLQAASSSVFSQDKDDASPVVVRMTDEMKFVPDQLTVHVGQTVKWVNEGENSGASHSVTTNADRLMDPKHASIPAGAKPFDSGIINPGKSFSYTFKVPGLYKYACAPHEGMMRGEITVEQ
jgi:plastocyanin